MLINKPAGMLSQKAEKGDISMVEHLISHLLDTGEVTEEMLKTFRPSLCNRLDRNTSGIVAAGKTLQGLQMLSGLFKERTLHKYYLCIVKGVIKEEQDVRGWLLKNEKDQPGQNFQKRDKGCQTDPHKIPSACRQWAGDASGDRASDRTYTSDSCPFVLYGTSDLR